MNHDDGLLYVTPVRRAAEEPLVDDLTRKMTAALRRAQPEGLAYRGTHRCACGAVSRNRDLRLLSGEQTNSLCVHYLAYHRHEIDPDQLARVSMLDEGEEEPTVEELAAPPRHPLGLRPA